MANLLGVIGYILTILLIIFIMVAFWNFFVTMFLVSIALWGTLMVVGMLSTMFKSKKK